MEIGRGFSAGFSAVIPGDTTRLSKLKESQYNAPAEFGFHFQKRVYKYNDIAVSVGLQDVVFESEQTSEEMLSLNTLFYPPLLFCLVKKTWVNINLIHILDLVLVD